MEYRHLADHHARDIEISDADGVHLFGPGGRKYLDFIAGWCVGNVGWKRPEIAEALKREAARGMYVPQFFRSEAWESFAELLVSHAPGDRLKRAYRCTSGSEAVEFAVKCARAATGRKTIVSIDGVYHGHTYGAASVGEACSPQIAPCVPEMIKVRAFEDGAVRPAAEILKDLERVFRKHEVAAFLSEPVWTNAGAYVPPPDLYPEIEKLCRQHGALLAMDEVATGFGRCGRLFASGLWGLSPDILCLGKGLTGGYATMGATLVSEDVFRKSRGIPDYSTFGWTATDLAAARANVEVIVKERLWENAERLGAEMLERLKTFSRFPQVGTVRGIGLLLAVDILDPRSRKPDGLRAAGIQDACAEAGVLIETAGHALFMTPPLILGETDARHGLGILESALAGNT